MNPDLHFIGRIQTPYKALTDCPDNIQPNGPLCQINVYDKYQDGLSGLAPEQHILILYWFENTDRTAIVQKVNHGRAEKGTFSLRSPHRPNPIGAAVLPIEKIHAGQITVRGLDCLDGTQIVDIKPAIYHESEQAHDRKTLM